ncbi:hypothetical protein Q1695_010830 [Nippostrongylus brasiliensis]|nr:hypothetical protein Q1695_010830 [Nippostrongylus brasiliensis]
MSNSNSGSPTTGERNASGETSEGSQPLEAQIPDGTAGGGGQPPADQPPPAEQQQPAQQPTEQAQAAAADQNGGPAQVMKTENVQVDSQGANVDLQTAVQVSGQRRS